MSIKCFTTTMQPRASMQSMLNDCIMKTRERRHNMAKEYKVISVYPDFKQVQKVLSENTTSGWVFEQIQDVQVAPKCCGLIKGGYTYLIVFSK